MGRRARRKSPQGRFAVSTIGIAIEHQYGLCGVISHDIPHRCLVMNSQE